MNSRVIYEFHHSCTETKICRRCPRDLRG